MPTQYKNPVSGFPDTTEFPDPDGKPAFRIAPKVFTPLRAKARDGIFAGLAVIMALTCVDVIMNARNIDREFLVALCLQAGQIYVLITLLFYYTLRRKTRIVMTTGSISVRRWYGFQRFDRHADHKFYLVIHDWAEREQEDHARKIHEAAQHGKTLKKRVYFGKSWHIALSYGAQRIDLLTVFGAKEAEAVLGRLQFCDAQLDLAMSMNGGASDQSGGSWQQSPGGL